MSGRRQPWPNRDQTELEPEQKKPYITVTDYGVCIFIISLASQTAFSSFVLGAFGASQEKGSGLRD